MCLPGQGTGQAGQGAGQAGQGAGQAGQGAGQGAGQAGQGAGQGTGIKNKTQNIMDANKKNKPGSNPGTYWQGSPLTG